LHEYPLKSLFSMLSTRSNVGNNHPLVENTSKTRKNLLKAAGFPVDNIKEKLCIFSISFNISICGIIHNMHPFFIPWER